MSAGNDFLRTGMGGYTGGTGAVDGIQLLPSSGNFTSGTVVLVGWKFGP